MRKAPVASISARLSVSLPHPNAFDGCVEAARLVCENADDVRQINEAYNTEHFPFPSALGSAWDKERKQILVKKNEASLNLLRDALRFPYHEPPAQDGYGKYPHLFTYRELARLCVADGDVKREGGDILGAMEAYLDAIAFGQSVPRGGPFITRLVGCAVQAIGRRPIWKHLSLWNSEVARQGAKRMETICADHVPMAETWLEEKAFGQKGRLNKFQNTDDMAHTLFSSELARYDDPPPASLWEKMRVFLLIGLWGKGRTVNHFATYMDTCIGNSRLPYARRTAVLLPADPFNRRTLGRIASIFETTALKDVNTSQTQNALLCAALALQAFRADTGDYPATLRELVAKGILSNVPDDPFSPTGSEPLGYRRVGPTEMVLWSVGPDGKDDNGTPILDATQTGNARYFVTGESRGDIVAGTNIF